PPAVDVTLKLHAAVVDLSKSLQREDLKAARVGEEGPLPRHELVEPTELGDDIFAGTDVEVIGVREDDLGAYGFEIRGRQRPDRRLRTDGHEYGRLDRAVGQRQRTGSCSSGLPVDPKVEH